MSNRTPEAMMILFLIKKSFFDAWDNLYRVIILNFCFMLCIAAAIALPLLLGLVNPVLFFLAAVPGILLLMLLFSFSVVYLKDAADYRSTDFKAAFRIFRNRLKKSIVFALINIILLMLFIVAGGYYRSLGGMPGAVGFSIVFWAALVWSGSVQYFLPLMYSFDDPFPKTLRKSFIMFFDNVPFSIFTMFWSLVIILFSFLSIFILVGVGSLSLFQVDMLKLRMYKYDYLEEKGAKSGVKIPWRDLLEEERENIGKRTLKGMIFPWK